MEALIEKVEKPTDVSWLMNEFSTKFALAIEVLTGGKYRASAALLDTAPAGQGLLWSQPFQPFPGTVWIVAGDEAWKTVGAQVLRALGIEETDDQLRAEYLEIARQAVAGVARAISERVGVDVTPGVGEQTQAFGEAQWGVVEISLDGVAIRISVGVEPQFLSAIVAQQTPKLAAPKNTNAKTAENSKTFDLLLDLELPVSISFGRAQVPLKDVLKLAVGSIVELNRAIGDRVEVIVNNCVIARGQVVVVDGNFGVRIQNVISTQERLKSLD